MASGLRKAKKYDWKDSNMALFGSDTDRKVKKESASHELAWKHAGTKTGLQIWRIVKFKVKTWDLEEYGNFYSGDSYIILNTYKDKASDKLMYDVHFWIGKYSTQDEYGTAAYKTVELDTYLDDQPVQHREVQGHESELFRTYFKAITLLEGGAETGFRSVRQETPTERLFHVHGKKKNILIKEITRKRSNLNPGDVYILDLGLEIYQWNGEDCNKDEKFKAPQYVQELRGRRNGKPRAQTLDQNDMPKSHPFYEKLDQEDVQEYDSDDDKDVIAIQTKKSLYRLSDESGSLEFNTLIKDGTVRQDDLKSEDVFLLDTQKELFVWIGNRTSADEKKNGIPYAHKFLMGTDHPCIPVTVIKEDQKETPAYLGFQAALDG